MSRIVYKYNPNTYIAGHGDVFKHVVFCACIRELQKEHPSIVLIDTHCGDGVYDLNVVAKNGSIQYRKAILKVLQKYETERNKVPPIVQDFIELLLKSTGCTGTKDLDVYPGSPIYGQHLLRKNIDVHKLCDYYIDYVDWLQDSNAFEQLDSYDPDTFTYYMIPSSSTSSHHPVFFIDPPYDDYNSSDESYGQAKQLLIRILDWNPLATVIMYIPHIANHSFRYSYTKLIRDIAKEKCKSGRYYCSINVNPNELQGSGIVVCNPTSTLDDVINDDVVHWLATTMNQGKDEFIVEQVMKKKKNK